LFVERGEFLLERTKRKGSKLVNKPEYRGLVVRKKTEGSTLVNQGSNNRKFICGARNKDDGSNSVDRASVLKVAPIVDEEHVVDKDDKTNLKNLEFRQSRVCSAKFVATLIVS
jgi:hypothetical protein